MIQVEKIKEAIFVLITLLLLVSVIGLFVYIIRTEQSSVQMADFLSSLRTETEHEEEVKESLDKSLLESQKFRQLQENPVPDRTFDAGTRNPFRPQND